MGKRQSEKRKMELYDQDIHSNIVSFRGDLSLVDDLIYQFGAANSTVIWASTSSSSLTKVLELPQGSNDVGINFWSFFR